MPLDATKRQGRGERCVELDWLRMLVVLATIPFHAVPVIGAQRAVFILSAESNPLLALLGGFVLTWGIPLIFLMAGAATRFALDVRSPGAYMRERIVRLGAPLLLVALLFTPLQLYFILLSNPTLNQNPGVIPPGPQNGIASLFADQERLRDVGFFFQQYLRSLVTFARGYSPAIGSFVLSQLWFVPRLLVVSFICLPLLLYLRGRGRRVAQRIVAIAAHPAVLLFVGGLAPAVLVAALQPGWLNRVTADWVFTDDWPSFFLDLVMFLYGYLIYSSARLRAVVRAHAIIALVLAAICAGIVAVVFALGRAPATGYSPASLLFVYIETLMAWLFVLALVGLAMRYLTVSTPLQRYLTDAAFPVFVLHGPLLAASAYYVLRIPLPGIVQLALILVVTVASAFAIYEYVVRRTPVTRFVFGAKPPQASGHAQ